MPANALVATFSSYNQAIWPVQLALLALAIALLVAAGRGGEGSGRIVYAGLAVLWAWCGAVFFLAFFTRVWAGAWVAGGAFVVQAALFLRAALVRQDSVMAWRADGHGIVGGTLLAYALLFYPLLASALGQHYPAQPTFGAPCPITIFTFGMLLLVAGRVPGHILVVPFVWALFGIGAVLRFGVLEDIGLIAAGLVALPLILARNRHVGALPPMPGVGETPAPMQGTGRLQ